MLSELFLQNENSEKLGKRKEGFHRIMQHLDHTFPNTERVIVETGCARWLENWEGDGCSTYWWNLAADNLANQRVKPKVYSVDIDPVACAQAQEAFPNVQITCMDSVQFLNGLPEHILKRVGLLYLDSFDWKPDLNLESSFHHMAELAAVWAKLPDGCMIVVDDRHTDQWGKHVLVEFFMQKLAREPVFRDYQIAWIK